MFFAPMALRDPRILDDTLTADERKVLDALVAELKVHYGERLERVAVFGSRARGDLGPDSDIDLLIVLRVAQQEEFKEREVIWSLIARAWRLAPDAHVPISPAVFSRERFDELRARERRFAVDAENEGIRL